MLHIIAYRDQTGRDFNGLPWVMLAPDDFGGAKELYNKMCQEYKDVILLECEDYEFEREEVVTWRFANDYKILPE